MANVMEGVKRSISARDQAFGHAGFLVIEAFLVQNPGLGAFGLVAEGFQPVFAVGRAGGGFGFCFLELLQVGGIQTDPFADFAGDVRQDLIDIGHK